MIIRRLFILFAALANVPAWPTADAQDVLWQNPGISDYNTPANWSTGFVPDYTFNERAIINNGGTAYLEAVAATPAAGVALGELANQSGTLEIRSGGSLNTQIGAGGVGNPPDGRVIVGGAGTGTLRVLPGGTLNATQLYSAGNAASSITIGSFTGGTATVNVDGGMHLERTTSLDGVQHWPLRHGSVASTIASSTGTTGSASRRPHLPFLKPGMIARA